jgi:RecA/RadA recombinase
MAGEREKALEAAVGEIKKRYGDGAVMRLGEAYRPVLWPSILPSEWGVSRAAG